MHMHMHTLCTRYGVNCSSHVHGMCIAPSLRELLLLVAHVEADARVEHKSVERLARLVRVRLRARVRSRSRSRSTSRAGVRVRVRVGVRARVRQACPPATPRTRGPTRGSLGRTPHLVRVRLRLRLRLRVRVRVRARVRARARGRTPHLWPCRPRAAPRRSRAGPPD